MSDLYAALQAICGDDPDGMEVALEDAEILGFPVHEIEACQLEIDQNLRK